MSQDPVPYLVNLSLVVLARRSSPAQKERAEYLLRDIAEHDPDEPSVPRKKTWWQEVREACPEWREI